MCGEQKRAFTQGLAMEFELNILQFLSKKGGKIYPSLLVKLAAAEKLTLLGVIPKIELGIGLCLTKFKLNAFKS